MIRRVDVEGGRTTSKTKKIQRRKNPRNNSLRNKNLRSKNPIKKSLRRNKPT